MNDPLEVLIIVVVIGFLIIIGLSILAYQNLKKCIEVEVRKLQSNSLTNYLQLLDVIDDVSTQIVLSEKNLQFRVDYNFETLCKNKREQSKLYVEMKAIRKIFKYKKHNRPFDTSGYSNSLKKEIL